MISNQLSATVSGEKLSLSRQIEQEKIETGKLPQNSSYFWKINHSSPLPSEKGGNADFPRFIPLKFGGFPTNWEPSVEQVYYLLTNYHMDNQTAQTYAKTCSQNNSKRTYIS